MRKGLTRVVPNLRQHFCLEMADDKEHIYAANGRGIQSPGPRKPAHGNERLGSGVHLLSREEAFVLEPL